MSGHVLARSSDLASREAEASSASRAADPAATAPTTFEPHDAAGRPQPETRESVPLTSLGRQATGIVAGVRLAPGAEHDPAYERMALRLIEIGFVQGAELRVVAFGQPGGDPIGVRVGGRGGVSTFALRRQEADCVWVWPERS